MRSSVSVILSGPSPDVNMSYPDYDTHPLHHSTLLVLVKQVGSQLKSRSFHKLYERISRVNHVKVSDSNGAQRSVWLAYKREYHPDNNDWGEFQTHRKLLGIITIGQVGSQSDLNDICKQHESLKVKYSSTLYDSRCIILGLNPDSTIYSTENNSSRNTSPEPLSTDVHAHIPRHGNIFGPSHAKKLSAGSADRDSGVYETNSSEDCNPTNGDCEIHETLGTGSDSGSESAGDLGRLESDIGTDSPRSVPEDTSRHDSLSPAKTPLQNPSYFKTRALYYPTAEHAVNIEAQLQEFASSLFWVLESKRLDKSHEKLDKPPLLCAPFEQKDFVGLDMESRANKKRCFGRLKKQLGDLSLQVGLPLEAISLYTQASDILKNCNDWLWLAASYEGLCTASIVLMYPHMRCNTSLQRYASLGVGGGPAGPLGKTKNGSITTNSLPAGLEPSIIKQNSKYCLTAGEIVEKYREAVLHYSKYRNAGVIETEASIKAVHVLIEQRRYLPAADFLSNVVFINLHMSDEEKIIRFNALAELYHQIGFHRKASFYRRVAAMRCVAPSSNDEPNWMRCYQLLLQTLEGYKITLDPLEFQKDGCNGWPGLQIQILQELAGTSRRLGEHPLYMRHQAFLLSAMLPHLKHKEKEDIFNMLDNLSGQCATTSMPLVVEQTGVIIPPVNFYNIPQCRSIKVLPPTKEKKVEQISTTVVEEKLGPFIFSPFACATNSNKVVGKMDFEWVEGDVCEVTLELDNPMHFELKVSSMTLLCEGVPFDSWVSTIVLPPNSKNQPITLRGRPQGVGELNIIGYSSVISGVNSNCRLKFIPHLKIPMFIITIVPALPSIQIFCEEASSGTGLVGVCDKEVEETSTIQLTLDAGETGECNISIHNVSSQPVEKIDIVLDCKSDRASTDEVFQYSLENLQAQLPIPPGRNASLTLYVYGASDFLRPGKIPDDLTDINSTISGSEPPSMLSGGPSSLPSRHSMTNSSMRANSARRTDSTLSMSSTRSGSSTKSSSSTTQFSCKQSTASKTQSSMPGGGMHAIEGTVKLKYSGGKGLLNNYWRVAEVSVCVEVIPSLLVTKWDALPAELSHQCYIVLDLLNTSIHEMDLQYTPSKHLLIEAGESCRVPVPVDRCPLDKMKSSLEQVEENNDPVRGPSEILGDHVSSLVELRWILGPDDIPGRASLKGITFPPHTHDLITMLPIHWEVKLNNNVVNGTVDDVGKVGQTQNMTVVVTNTSSNSLPPLHLRIITYQDHQNGQHNYRLDAKMSMIGTNRLIIPQLKTDEAFTHTCGMIFFTAGVYKVEISCSPTQDSMTAVYENVMSRHHAWKFSPPLEITVEDC